MKYQIMFYSGLVIAVITLILAIISFFKLNVAEALCDLVGVKIDIKNIFKINKNKKERGKINKIPRDTKVDSTVRIEKKKSIVNNKSMGNYKNRKEKTLLYNNLNSIDNESTTILDDESTTLIDNESTTILDEEVTTLIEDEVTTLLESEETTIISDDLEGTVLIEDDNGFSDEFIKEINIVLINSDVII